MINIYKVTNLVNGKSYIGQTKMKLKDRMHAHRYTKRGAIYEDIQKYGIQNFSISIIDSATSKEDANNKERFWTLFFKTSQKEYGYNREIVKSIVGRVSPMKGKSMPESAKVKISEAHKGKKSIYYGKHLSEETKNKISASLKGRYIGEKNPMFGKPGPRKGMESPMKGKKHSKESIQKMKESRRGENSKVAKKVVNIDTGEIFISLKEAGNKYGISSSTIWGACNGKQKTAGKFHWKYVD